MLSALWTAWLRLIDPWRRRTRDARLAEELHDHLARLRADFEARGLSPADADLEARRAFGGVDQVTVRYRDQRGWPAFDALAQDLRFAGRYLLRDRAFAMPVVLVLALGIGVGHMFLTLTYAHVLRGLPIEDAERVLSVTTVDVGGAERGVSYRDFVDLRTAQRTFADLAAYAQAPITLGDEGEVPDRVDGAFTTASGFTMTGVRPRLGRGFATDDERPGAPPTVVLAERVWRSRYHSDAGLVGREVLVNGTAATVIGIVSDRSGFPSGAGAFLPLAALPGVADAAREARNLRVFGRLTARASAADASAELDALASELARQFPATNDGVRVVVDTINYRLLGGSGTVRGFLPFITAGLIVLAVASTNAGNLLLVGAAGRAREVAVRTALGASRRRIVRQLLVESLLLVMLATAIGLVLSRAGVGIYRQWIPNGVLPVLVRLLTESMARRRAGRHGPGHGRRLRGAAGPARLAHRRRRRLEGRRAGRCRATGRPLRRLDVPRPSTRTRDHPGRPGRPQHFHPRRVPRHRRAPRRSAGAHRHRDAPGGPLRHCRCAAAIPDADDRSSASDAGCR